MDVFRRMVLFCKVKLAARLERADDPRETLDYAYAQQQELLRQVRHGVVEVATSRRLLEEQARRLENRVPHSEQQATQAISAGREDLARIALGRKQTALAEIQELNRRLTEVTREEQRLGLAEQRLTATVDEFKGRRISLGASYAAAEAQARALEALTGVSKQFAEIGMAVGRAEERIERMQAKAVAIDALIEGNSLSAAAGLDPVERELRALASGEAIERELGLLRANLTLGEPGPAGLLVDVNHQAQAQR